ncbi:MAG: hypothetical protein HN738_14195 [Gammaproteobacteria bacterium]|nr:hypothetical protein [Gammaproteobacteria bacterium]MBT7879226.1 hypothetical protein [Gammaproteobacteria bacterium]
MAIYEAMRTIFAASTGIGNPVKQLKTPRPNPREDCTFTDTFAGVRFGG